MSKRAVEEPPEARGAPRTKARKTTPQNTRVRDLLRQAPLVLMQEIKAGRLTENHPYGQQLAYIVGILTKSPLVDLWDVSTDMMDVLESIHSMKASCFHSLRGVEAERPSDNWWDNVNFPFPCEDTVTKQRPKMIDLKINGCYPDNFVRLWETDSEQFLSDDGAYTSTVINDDRSSNASFRKVLVHLHGCGDKMSIHPTTGHGVWSYDKGSDVSSLAIAYNFWEAADPDKWNDPVAKAAPGFRMWHQLADQVVEELVQKYPDRDEIPHTELKTEAFKILRAQLASGLYVVIWTPMTLQNHVRQTGHPSIVGGAFLIGKEDSDTTKKVVEKCVRFLDVCLCCMKERCFDKCSMANDLSRCTRCAENGHDCVVFRPISMTFDGAAFNRPLPDLLEKYGIAVQVDASHGVKGFVNHLRNWAVQIDSLESVVQLMPLLASLSVNEDAGSELLRRALGAGWSVLSADLMHHSVIQAFVSPAFDDMFRELKYVVYVGAPAVTRFSSAVVVSQRSRQMKLLVGKTPLGWSLLARGYLYWSGDGLTRLMSHTNPRSRAAADVRMKTNALPGLPLGGGDHRTGVCEFKSNTGELRSFLWAASKFRGEVSTIAIDGIHKDAVVVGDKGFLDDKGLTAILNGRAIPINAKSLMDDEWRAVIGQEPKVHRMEAARSAYVPCLLDVYVLLSTRVLLVITTHTVHSGANSSLPDGWVTPWGQCVVGTDTSLVSTPGYTKPRGEGIPALGSWKVVASNVCDFDVFEGGLVVSFDTQTVALWESDLFVDRLKIARTRGDYVKECVRTEQYLAREEARQERLRLNVPRGEVGGVHARLNPGTSIGRSSQGGAARLDRVPWYDQLDELWSSKGAVIFSGWASIRSTVSNQVFLWTTRGAFALLSDLSLDLITSPLFSRSCLGRASSAFIGVPSLNGEGLVEHGLLPHGGDGVCVQVCGCKRCRQASMLDQEGVPMGHPRGTAGRGNHLPSTLFEEHVADSTPVLLVIQSTSAPGEVCRRVGDFLLATGEAKETAGPGPDQLNVTLGGKRAVYTATLAVCQLILGMELDSWRLPGRFVYETVDGKRVRSFEDSGKSPMNLSSAFWKKEMRKTFGVSWGGRKAMFPVSLLRAFLATLRALSVIEERMKVGFVRYGRDEWLRRALEATRFCTLILCFAYLSSMLCEWLFGRVRALHSQPGTVAGSAVWSTRRVVMDCERSKRKVVTQAPRSKSSKIYGAGPGHGTRWAVPPQSERGCSTIRILLSLVHDRLNSYAIRVGRREPPTRACPEPMVEGNEPETNFEDEEEEDDDVDDEGIWERSLPCPEDCECGCRDVDESGPSPTTRGSRTTEDDSPIKRQIRSVVDQLLRAASAQHQLMPDRWAFTKHRESHCHHAN